MWGRKRRPADAERRLAAAMEAAAEAHRRLEAPADRVDGLYRAIQGACGHGDGMPRSSTREALADVPETLESCRHLLASYAEIRGEWTHAEVPDPDAIDRAAHLFASWAEQTDEAAAHLEELLAALTEVRANLDELRIALPPVRARAHAAVTAARDDLLWARSPVPGRFALEARLNALGDRLRELDAGRVELVEDGDDVTEWYREVETGAAEVRDALSRPLSFGDR
ncbi:hypothetical protein J7W19_13945 [Streptomyces mobaraensis NBRC 13819 = DSM 40847]|uniref:Uncharacterized protein n=1 Tax=Streptomyces mobaraensis (strain ATCC 29032 / DSM 40847 / JCM 4168 / NBRC 13819 / NCIMB 11159 / IPCR 16-22) TaxID=1223523 RepID=M3C1W3_STRM1|nr:hypothetical protein [Streptomyces mobaraensis]EME97995.1 hypothetical protein H340_23653 [Streptomyces mobaraensis NBRC 13819 = DSM 40847]QTT74363.1 hypothetical protein J7W19_13945 [Streptomyces mobaraensis NBRC 13819 = DSM 40847]